MRLGPSQILVLFAIGAAGGLAGDAGHVTSHTTRYLTHGAPFVWESPVWFAALVGLATVWLADLRLRLSPLPRGDGTWTDDGLTAIAAVVGLYAVTALVSDEAQEPALVLVAALALLGARWVGITRAAAVCALAAAVVGPAFEIVLVHTDVFEYRPGARQLFGVPLWLPALYGLFGVVAARLGELSAARPSQRRRRP